MAVRKLKVKEDFNDRINSQNVTLDSSVKYGELLRNLDFLYNMLSTDDAMGEIKLTSMALETGYDSGTVSRTAINGFNRELEKANKTVSDLITCLSDLKYYGQEHINKDVWNELDKENDWFRKHRR